MSRPAPLLVRLPAALLLAAATASAPAGAAERVVDVIEPVRLEPAPPLRPQARWTAPGRPTVALALSGGGSRGLAHVGVLAALAEEGIEIDGIAGTSAGALVGGLHAAGYEPDEIADLVRTGQLGEQLSGLDERQRTLSRTEDLARSSAQLRLRRRRGNGGPAPGGLLAARDLDRELQRLLLLAQAACDGDFDRLLLRFRAVATDLVSGRKFAPSRGRLSPLLTGSATVPGLMGPVAYDGALLVDGGLRENVPVETARALGVDVVIAVDVSQGVDPGRELGNALAVLDRSLDIVMDAKTQESLGRADAVLKPRVRFAARSDLREESERLLEAGRVEVAAQRDDLFEVLKDLAPDRQALAVDRLELRGGGPELADELSRRLGLGEPAPIPRWRVASELARLLNRRPYGSARAELVERDGERILRVHVQALAAPAGVMVEGREAPTAPETPSDLSFPALRASAWPLRRASLANGDAFAHAELIERAAVPVIRWQRLEVRSAAVESPDEKLPRASRRVAKLTGERFDYDRLAFRLDDLAARGLVRRWRLGAVPEDGGVHLVADLEPDRPDELGLGGAYRGDLKWAGLIRLSRANLRGSGEALVFTASGGEEIATAELAWQSPYGFGLRTTGWELGVGWRSGSIPSVEPSQQYGALDTDRYEANRVWAGLVHRAGRRRLDTGLAQEHRKLPLPGGGAGPEHVRTALYLHYSLDGQDRLLFPTRGGRLDVAGDAAVSGDQLWHLSARGAWAFPLDGAGATVLTTRAGAGMSGHAEHRSFWFDPGGHASLYGWVPHGARAAQFARAGGVLRRRLLTRPGFDLHAELGAEWLRTAFDRDDLEDAPSLYGWGLSVTASLPWLGPLSVGWSGNDAGGDAYWITAGFPFLDP